MRRCRRWAVLGLAALAIVVAGDAPAFAWLDGGVQAMRSIAGQWVELKLTVDSDCLIRVVIGKNEITFPVKKGAELRTGRLRNTGDLVQVFRNGQLVCQIPVERIPEGRFERFCYDKAPPVVRVTPSPGPNSHGWNNTVVTITVTAEDEKDGSGIRALYYKIGTRSPVEVGKEQLTLTEGGRAGTYSLRLSSEDTYYLGFWAVDEAGNESASQSLTVKIDTTRPIVNLSPSGGRYQGSVNINWAASDGFSGLASCAVYVGTTRVSTSSSGSHTLSPGTHSVEVRAEDKAGNTASTSISYTVYRPSFFQVTEVTASPSTLQVGQTSTIRATIKNTGEESGTRTITLYINNSPAGTRPLTLNAGASDTVPFTHTFNAVGNHAATVSTGDDSRSTTVRVEANPPYFQVTGLSIFPSNPKVGDRVTISATVKNTGGSYGDQWIRLWIDDVQATYRPVRLDPGQSTPVSFYHTFDRAKTYAVKVSSDNDYAYGTVSVTCPGTPPVIRSACVRGMTSGIGPGMPPGGSANCFLLISFYDPDGDITHLLVDGRAYDVRSHAYGEIWGIIDSGFPCGGLPVGIQLRDAAGNLSSVVRATLCTGR